ncbi:centromere protein W [Phyllobates terribilis]|uniref:centromere protein W n=1 Tax=Phyllobates terribilis TaxID=111132 RepID=UPI003CCB0E35
MLGSVPRGTIRAAIKQRLPHLQMDSDVDLLVYLSLMLFLQRLATEARLRAVEDRCSVIKSAHIRAVAKVVLKKSRG